MIDFDAKVKKHQYKVADVKSNEKEVPTIARMEQEKRAGNASSNIWRTFGKVEQFNLKISRTYVAEGWK